MTWIIAKLVLGGVPQRFAKVLAYLGAIIAAIAFLWGLKAIYDRSIVREHEAEVTQAVSIATQAGAEAAASASASTAATIEASNDAARKAAAGSDDRLKAGLDSLRANPKPER